MRVLRVESGLFFANADSVRAALRRHASEPGVETIVLDAEAAPFIDVSAVRMLDELSDDLERRGIRLLLAGEIGQVRDVMRLAGESAGLRRAFPSVAQAVDAAAGARPFADEGSPRSEPPP